MKKKLYIHCRDKWFGVVDWCRLSLERVIEQARRNFSLVIHFFMDVAQAIFQYNSSIFF